jgi:ankyrin repeat protein
MTTSYHLKQAPQHKITAQDALKAVRKGDLETVQIFLTQEGINVNQLIGKLTLLVSAIKDHQFPIVQKLLAAKADCTAPVRKFLPLEHAIIHKQFDIIEALIEAKADINAIGGYKRNLLFSYMCDLLCRPISAAEEKEGAVKMIKFLLQHKADPNGKLADKRECPFAFTMLINLGRSDIFEALIHAKADVNCTDMDGDNALRMAYQEKRYDLARLLVDAGSDPTKVFTPKEMSSLFLQLGERYRQEAASNEASEKTMLLPGNVSSHVIAPLLPELYPSYVFTPAPARSYVEHHDPILSAYWKNLEVTKTPMLETIPVVGTSSDVAQPSSLEPVKPRVR